MERTFLDSRFARPVSDANSRFVSALYQDLLGRPPEPFALQSYTAQLAGGAPRSAVVQAILASPEADTRLSQTVLSSVYQHFLNRPATGPELSGSWFVMQASVRQVMTQILSSQEYFTRANTRP